MPEPFNCLLLALLLFTSAAAVSDWKLGHISNRLTLAAATTLFALNIWVVFSGLPASEAWLVALLNSSLGLVACGLAPYLLWRLDCLGGGDVKLLSAMGLGLGPALGVQLGLLAFTFAAGWLLLRVVYLGNVVQVLRSTTLQTLVLCRLRPAGVLQEQDAGSETFDMRFAPAIFGASVVTAVFYWRGGLV